MRIGEVKVSSMPDQDISFKKRKRQVFVKDLKRQADLQLMILPAILHIFVFAYIPMYGILMAFQEFRMGDFPGFSAWVGVQHFTRLVRDPNFSTVLRNTVMISLLKMVINFPVPIFFAVFLNEVKNKHFKKSVQTISYLPYFISWVVGAAMLFDFFSVDNGAVNSGLIALGILDRPIHFFGRGELFWGMAVATDLWKMLGWNSIIFFAAISAIDSTLYEAAEIDGAGRYAKMWFITISTIKPTIILLFIFTIGNMLNTNFDQIMMLTNQMGNARLREYADVIDTYVYRVGIREGRFSYAAAAGFFKSIVNIALLFFANYLASRSGNEVF